MNDYIKMLLHYLKITFRNLWKHKTQSLVGIFGLALGLACFVPALYWLRYETSYDSFYPNSENIYRIYTVEKQTGKVSKLVPEILKRKLHEQFPAMESSTVFFIEPDKCSTEGMPHIDLHILHTDNSLFLVFPQVIVCGDTRQPLPVMNNIAITETVAIRLFGNVENAIGQQIKSTIFDDNQPYTVTSILKNPPLNTNLRCQITNMPFDAILLSEYMKFYTEKLPEEVRWTIPTMQAYVKLHSATDVNALAEQLRDFTSQFSVSDNIEVRMIPVSTIRHRLDADVPFTLNFIRLLVAAGMLLIFSGVFNFLNLHLDLFDQRIRELRQRAVHGAKNRQLIMQMMFELTCAIVLALLNASFLAILVHPVFSKMSDISISMLSLIRLFIVCGSGVMVLMQFCALIPFRRLSQMVLHHLSERKIVGRKPVFRHTTVTLQLAVSIVLIVASLVVMMQMRFIYHKELGFDSAGVIHLSGFSNVPREKATSLMHELSAIPQIENISTTFFKPQHNANPQTIITEVEWQGKPLSEKPAFHVMQADSLFAKTLGLKMLMGKWFDNVGNNKIVLNEEAVRVMRIDEPIGSVIHMNSPYASRQEYEIIGVVKDFHTLSLRNRILPTIFLQYSRQENLPYYIRIIPGLEREAIQRINTILPGIDPSLADVMNVYKRFDLLQG